MSAETNPPPHLKIHLLRTLKISQAGGPNLRLASSKAEALLYYVAMSGRMDTRSALAALLWGDHPEEAARSNLRHALVNLEILNEFDVGPTAETVDLQKAIHQDQISVTPPQVEVSSAANHLTWLYDGASAPLQTFRLEQSPKIQNTKNPGSKSWRTLRPVIQQSFAPNTQLVHARLVTMLWHRHRDSTQSNQEVNSTQT